MGRKVLILHLPELEGRRYSSKEGELVGCFKRKLTHLLGDLKLPTTATLGPGLGGLVPFPGTTTPSPFPAPPPRTPAPQTLKGHARGFQPSRSARSLASNNSPGRGGPRGFPRSLCPCAMLLLGEACPPGRGTTLLERQQQVPALGPPNPPPLALSILTSGGTWEAWEHLSRLLSRGQCKTQGQRGDSARVCGQVPGVGGAALRPLLCFSPPQPSPSSKFRF